MSRTERRGVYVMELIRLNKELYEKNPEKYPDLIGRVAGFSAVFVDLSPEIQQELLSRVLYDERKSLC